MSCEHIQRIILDCDWNRAALDQAATVLAHLDTCPACREALGEYDALRSMLRLPESIPEPDEDELRRPLGGVSATRSSRHRIHALAVALAVAVLAAAGGWVLYFQSRHLALNDAALPTRRAPDGPMPTFPRLTGADVSRRTELFRTVSETFGGRTGWVAVTDDAADLGLMPESMASNGKVFLLRIVLSDESRPIANTDLIIRPGQAARLEVGLPSGRLLHYQVATANTLEPCVSMWAEIREAEVGGQTLAALAASIRPVSGKTIDVGRMVSTLGIYNLELSFQQEDLPQVAL
mgnify:CR=1 FL=1